MKIPEDWYTWNFYSSAKVWWNWSQTSIKFKKQKTKNRRSRRIRWQLDCINLLPLRKQANNQATNFYLICRQNASSYKEEQKSRTLVTNAGNRRKTCSSSHWHTVIDCKTVLSITKMLEWVCSWTCWVCFLIQCLLSRWVEMFWPKQWCPPSL